MWCMHRGVWKKHFLFSNSIIWGGNSSVGDFECSGGKIADSWKPDEEMSLQSPIASPGKHPEVFFLSHIHTLLTQPSGGTSVYVSYPRTLWQCNDLVVMAEGHMINSVTTKQRNNLKSVTKKPDDLLALHVFCHTLMTYFQAAACNIHWFCSSLRTTVETFYHTVREYKSSILRRYSGCYTDKHMQCLSSQDIVFSFE